MSPRSALNRPLLVGANCVVLSLLYACGGSSGGGGGTPSSPTSTQRVEVTLVASSLVGGEATLGTVTLFPASASGATLTLSSSSPGIASVPASVLIPAASGTATFNVATTQVPTPTTVTIRATTASGDSGTGDLEVRQIPVCGPFLTAPVAVPFTVYTDDGHARNHYVPSGWFGDAGDLALTTADGNAQSGSTAIRIDYTPRGPQRFAGLFWECGGPFGAVQNAGFNLSLATQVQFFARASTSGVKAEFKVGGVSGAFPDSLASTPTSPVIVDLDTTWRLFTINVGGNRSRVIGGFMFVTSATQNPSGATIYLDEIVWR